MSKLVSVILVNFNGAKFLRECLSSVFRQTYPDIEVLLVDNGSTDGSVELARKEFPSVETVETGENSGFSRAVNLGIARTGGAFIMPLNFDITLDPGFVAEMVKAAESSARVGSASGKLLRLNEEGPTKVFDTTGHIVFRNRLSTNRGDLYEDEGQFDRVELVFGTSGAAPLYKREMVEDVSVDGEFYDEAFFSFLEDVDVDWRAQLLGWQCIYTPHAVAYHFRGGTGLHRSYLVQYHNYKNRYLMMMKNESGYGLVRNLPQIIFTDVFKSAALLVRHPRALGAWAEVVGLRREILAKRRVIQSRRRVGVAEMESLFERFNYPAWFRKHLTAD